MGNSPLKKVRPKAAVGQDFFVAAYCAKLSSPVFMKKISVVVVIILAGVLSAAAQKDDCSRTTDKGFSYCAPEFWTTTEEGPRPVKLNTGSIIRKHVGPIQDDFPPSFNVGVFVSAVPLKFFADTIKEGILKDKPEEKRSLVSSGAFTAASGANGHKTVFDFNLRGSKARAVLYTFDIGKEKVHFTCMTLQSHPTVDEKFFDAIMKTFRLEKK